MESDPWVILKNGLAEFNAFGAEKTASVARSVFALLRMVGLIGCAITMIIAIIRFSSSNPHSRAEAKSLFTKKMLLVFFIFTAAYFFGYILGIISLL